MGDVVVAVAVKVPDCWPLEIVIDAGTVTVTVLVLETATVVLAVAAPVRDTVQLDVWPGFNVVGAQDSEFSVCDVPPPEPCSGCG